jgi:hypothetical protein
MKNILTILVCCLCMPAIYAQKLIEKHMDFAQKKSVILNIQIADSIRILTWNKNEVYLKASVNVNDNKDNDEYKFTFNETGGNVDVSAKFDFKKMEKQCNCNCETKIYCDVYIPENAALSVETINGNIIISGNTAEIRAHSISGFVDLTLSANRKADFKLNTISGTIYSNISINTASSRSFTTHISDQYNGGGKPIDIETISGDIFFRKAE